jgi:hypothetical protein
MHFASVEIRCDGVTSSVLIDGQELSNKITAIHFQHKGGDYPKVYLEMPVASVPVVGTAIRVKKHSPMFGLLKLFFRSEKRVMRLPYINCKAILPRGSTCFKYFRKEVSNGE